MHVEGARDLIGQIRDVRIDAVRPNSLKGTLLERRERGRPVSAKENAKDLASAGNAPKNR